MSIELLKGFKWGKKVANRKLPPIELTVAEAFVLVSLNQDFALPMTDIIPADVSMAIQKKLINLLKSLPPDDQQEDLVDLTGGD